MLKFCCQELHRWAAELWCWKQLLYQLCHWPNPYSDCFDILAIYCQWTTTSFDFHQMAVHKRTTMLAHCNFKQNTWLCSKQSSFFFLLCTALWWQIKRRGGPLQFLTFLYGQTLENLLLRCLASHALLLFYLVLSSLFSFDSLPKQK